MTPKETVMALVAAIDDDMTFEAGKAVLAWRDEEHSGDCTKRPWSCLRCIHDETAHRADIAMKHILPDFYQAWLDAGVQESIKEQ